MSGDWWQREGEGDLFHFEADIVIVEATRSA